MAPTSTGHFLGDAVLPSALRLVGAVRAGDSAEILDAIAAAREAANDHPMWRTALILVLAGLVPDDASPRQLLAWNWTEEARKR
jgi:hypothetical protein